MTKAKAKHTAAVQEPSAFDLLVIGMFKMALPIWDSYEGAVPECELRNLEQASDWPHGLAAAIIKRLSEDADLRHWCAACD